MKCLKKWVLPLTIGLIFCAALCAYVAWFCVPAFEGKFTKAADTYELEIQTMTGTDLHTMELKKGDVLQIQFETAKGYLYMEIKAPDGTTVYRGHGRATKVFSLEIQKDGVYTINVEARRAKGNIAVTTGK